MGKEILRLIIRFAVRLAVAGVIFFAGVLLNGAVFNSNYGGGLPVIMLLFGAVAAVFILVAAIRLITGIVKTVSGNGKG